MTTCFSFPLLFFSVLQRPVPSFFLSRYLIIVIAVRFIVIAAPLHFAVIAATPRIGPPSTVIQLVVFGKSLRFFIFMFVLYVIYFWRKWVLIMLDVILNWRSVFWFCKVCTRRSKAMSFYDCDHFVTERGLGSSCPFAVHLHNNGQLFFSLAERAWFFMSFCCSFFT